MKSILLLFVAFLCFSAVNAQVTYTDYADTWVIDMNTPTDVDLNDDGVIDFKLNTIEDELAFVPIFFYGCFASTSATAMNNLNTREMQVFAEDETVKIDNFNMFDYIDDDRGSLYNTELGLADGWVANERQFIGVAVFNQDDPGKVYEAWMSVSINPETKQISIHEAAYNDWSPVGEGGIIVGDRGEAPTALKNIESLQNITIAPNPVQDVMNLSYEYTGSEPMTVTITNASGQMIYQQAANAKMYIPTSDWTAGIYVVRFENDHGVEIVKVMKQ